MLRDWLWIILKVESLFAWHPLVGIVLDMLFGQAADFEYTSITTHALA